MDKNQAVGKLITELKKAKGIMNDDEIQAVKQFMERKDTIFFNGCACMGPQENEPLCPCDMQMVETVNGKYYRISEMAGDDGMSIKFVASGLIKEL